METSSITEEAIKDDLEDYTVKLIKLEASSTEDHRDNGEDASNIVKMEEPVEPIQFVQVPIKQVLS